MADLSPQNFEQAMSHLVAAVRALDAHWPETECQWNRLAEQIGRADRIAAKSANAIRNKEKTI